MDMPRRKVLIVDDERIITETLTAIFSKDGYESRGAGSAEEALEVIAEWLPDLAIIDVALPGMNGIDLAIALKTGFPSCRLMLFSGQAATGGLLVDAAAKGHTFDVLAKPVHPLEMLDSAHRMLRDVRPSTTEL